MKGENICLRIEDFTPYAYLELPEHINWDVSKASLLAARLDDLLGDKRPIQKCLIFKYKLYYANLDENGNRKKFPFLFCSFSHVDDIRILSFKVRYEIAIFGLGKIKMRLHEHNASVILQYISQKNIPTAGWIKFVGKLVTPEEKLTLCDKEYIVKWKNTEPIEDENVAKPLLMGFDIEVNSHNPARMPDAREPKDKIFQIACVFSHVGEEKYEKYVLTLGEVNLDYVEEGINIISFHTEHDLILGFTDIVNKRNPNVLIGYNIFNFDIPYMLARSELLQCNDQFKKMGFLKDIIAKEETIAWSSSAYKNQVFRYIDAEGRLFVDLLPLIKRDYNLDNYKLKTVASFFLKGFTKKDLSAKGIFKCYRLGMKRDEIGKKALGICASYCYRDAVLMNMLFEQLQIWIGLTEMATICCVPIFYLYTKGQQIKVFSQIYKYCTHENITVENEGYSSGADEHYAGAKVFPPKPGVYDIVLPLDFSSLYPSIMIAYNFDYSTLVMDEKIPDSECNVIKWQDHIGCEHDPKIIKKKELTEYIDKVKEELKELRTEKKGKIKKDLEDLKFIISQKVKDLKPYIKERSELMKSKSKYNMCCKRKYRFLKSQTSVMPSVLRNLLSARKAAKDQIKDLQKQLKKNLTDNERKRIELLIVVLNKRQLAYKISANSCYGSWGVSRGYLPFMPGAMCVTAIGRKSITLAAKTIVNKYKGNLIYGDSVTGDTPLLLKNPDGSIFISRIDSINDIWRSYEEFKSDDNITRKDKQQCDDLKLQIWCNEEWCDVKRVIRHKTTKKMYRVLTHTGCVDVTEDHSLIDSKMNLVKPNMLKLGDSLLHSFPKEFNSIYSDISIEEAFVWGFFMTNGSCGSYSYKNYNKSTWTINSQNLDYLNEVLSNLKIAEPLHTFEILDTMKSSNAYSPSWAVPRYKLIPIDENHLHLCSKYRKLFYNSFKEKIVPNSILNSSFEVRKSFLKGYYKSSFSLTRGNMRNEYKSEEGKIIPDKESLKGSLMIDAKGKCGVQGLYYLLKSLGYKTITLVNNRESDVFRINTGMNHSRKNPIQVKKILELQPSNEQGDYVYDIETSSGVFHAGIGEIVVKNTDSNYVTFPHLEQHPIPEIWEYAEMVAKKISALFPDPMSLEFENIVYVRFLILNKKQYMSTSCSKDGTMKKGINKKGVLLVRRDNCYAIRDIYEAVVMKVFNKERLDDILHYIVTEINKLCSGCMPYDKLVMTQSIGDTNNMTLGNLFVNEKGKIKMQIGDYKVDALPNDEDEKMKKMAKKKANTEQEYYLNSLPAVVQLSERMKERGQLVSAGTRIEYIVTTLIGHTANKSEKIEDFEYFSQFSHILKPDYLWYLMRLVIPLDGILDVVFSQDSSYPNGEKIKPGFVKNQYVLRLTRQKMLDELLEYTKPSIEFE